jgi:DNA modification methylase
MNKIIKKHKNSLNDLTSTEWLPETISVWTQRGLGSKHPDTQIEKQHPAPFSFTDVSRLIKFFTKKNNTVLDPFVGVGSTLKACAIENRNGIGIELNPFFVKLSKKRLKDETVGNNKIKQIIIQGDSRQSLSKIQNESVDFVVTSPPYWNILSKVDHKVKKFRLQKNLRKDYGNLKGDLSNIKTYEDFLDQLVKIFIECKRVLKSGKYMSIIVSDFRHKSKYYMFHSDLMNALEKIGIEPKGLKVLYQRHKSVFPYGYPYAYVPNIHNQFILILQKPKKNEK